MKNLYSHDFTKEHFKAMKIRNTLRNMDLDKLAKIYLPKGIEVVAVVKLGGYYFWDWKFPFRHFKKEEIKVFTTNAIYDLK